MNTAINREFLLNPLYTQAHRHAQQKIYYKIRLINCTIVHSNKTYYYRTVQYNYNRFYSDLCELLLVINIFSHILVWTCVCLISTHLFLHKCTREEHNPVCASDSHTLSSCLSAFHSVKTDVHTDRPSFHPSARRRRRRCCPSSTTLPASQHISKTKAPRQAQQCVMCLAYNTLILPGPRLSSALPQACSSFGSPPD